MLTMHSCSRTGATVPYVEYPATGPASAVGRSAKLARSLGVAYVEAYAWDPGLLPAAAVARGVPAVELEVGGLGTATAEGDAVAATAITVAGTRRRKCRSNGQIPTNLFTRYSRAAFETRSVTLWATAAPSMPNRGASRNATAMSRTNDDA